MEKINLANIMKSFFLGLFIGVILQFYDNTDLLFSYRVLTILASGSIGFIIGMITEWLTSLLPIRLANSRTYFFINNIIALLVTAVTMCALVLITSHEKVTYGELLPILFIVLGIICAANLVDYLMYRRAQKRLNSFKASIKDQ